ncbi:hypothetical protein [Paenibacillus lemnae]|uniref:hypothetical protein n=1 Tax=Paenibacillus lemnae TaxID=1330551 RepID=UPI0031B6377A
MENHGFKTLDLIGSSSVMSLLSSEQEQYWAEQGKKDEWLRFLISLANDPSILGTSSHLLYIGRRT